MIALAALIFAVLTITGADFLRTGRVSFAWLVQDDPSPELSRLDRIGGLR